MGMTKQDKREARRLFGVEYFESLGYEAHAFDMEGVHLRVKSPAGSFDFWPTSQKFRPADNPECRVDQGVDRLVSALNGGDG